MDPLISTAGGRFHTSGYKCDICSLPHSVFFAARHGFSRFLRYAPSRVFASCYSGRSRHLPFQSIGIDFYLSLEYAQLFCDKYIITLIILTHPAEGTYVDSSGKSETSETPQNGTLVEFEEARRPPAESVIFSRSEIRKSYPLRRNFPLLPRNGLE